MVRIEISSELAVEAAQDVKVEFRSHTTRIIIGIADYPRIFLLIKTNEKLVFFLQWQCKFS